MPCMATDDCTHSTIDTKITVEIERPELPARAIPVFACCIVALNYLVESWQLMTERYENLFNLSR